MYAQLSDLNVFEMYFKVQPKKKRILDSCITFLRDPVQF